MYLENAIKVIEYAKAYNKKDATLRFALNLATVVLKKVLEEEQAKEEHEDLSEEYYKGYIDAYYEIMTKPAYFQLEKVEDDVGIVRCKNCDMWCDDNIIIEGGIKENIKPCAQWSGEGHIVFTKKNDFCSYGERRNE
jgi:hypothetical protein